jgi:hypothetical protein
MASPSPLVCVLLLVRGGETLPTTAGVKAEIERIWRLNGVAITFPEGKETCPESTARQILVYIGDRPEAFAAPPKAPGSSLGVTLVDHGIPIAVVYAFIDRAERRIEEGPRVGPTQLRLCLLLGRVIAHEIGHVLLRSRTHAAWGLMRAGFDGADCGFRVPAAYALTPEQRAVVHRHLAGASTGTRVLLAQAQGPK